MDAEQCNLVSRNVTPGVVQWALQKCKISYRIPYATLTQTDGLC